MSETHNTINLDRFVAQYVETDAKGASNRIRLAKIVVEVRDAGKETLKEFSERPEIAERVSLATLKQQGGIFDLYTSAGGSVSKPDATLWTLVQALYNVRPHVQYGQGGAKGVAEIVEAIKAGTMTLDEAQREARKAREVKATKAKVKREDQGAGEDQGAAVVATVAASPIDALPAILASAHKVLREAVVTPEDLDALRAIAETARKIASGASGYIANLESGLAKVAERAAK